MKTIKKVLSLFLVMLILSMAVVCVYGDDVVIHQIGSGKTLIRAVEYISTDNTSGTRDYTANEISPCIPIATNETVNLGAVSGLNTVYRINVAQAGQYRVKAWISRTSNNTLADVCVVSGREILARGIGAPGDGLQVGGEVATASFNLAAGEQDFHLRIHAVNSDPISKTDKYAFFYYFELERIDAAQLPVSVTASTKNQIEPEDVFYTDEGVTLAENSATISANKTAAFCADVQVAGNYAFTIKYKAGVDTSVNINNLTTDIYKNSLLPTDGDYLSSTLAVSNLSAGQNKIKITPDKDLEIEKIYINKISDESDLTAINTATKEADLEAAIVSAENALDVELTDATNAIFYKKPVYNRLLKKDYATISEFVKEYNEALISEYENPWVTLYVDDVKQTELATGDVKLTASTGYLPKGSTMIAVLYQNLNDNIKTMYKFAICKEVAKNSYDFLMDDIEIVNGNSYTIEFFYWDGLEKIRPIDVFDGIYEEIYVSTQGNDATGNGSKDNPYATIQKALEKVSEINNYQWGDIIVNVAGGTYTITDTIVIDEEHSGKNGYNVIIRGEEDDQPEINGGIKVTGWTEDENGIWKAPLSGIDYARNLYINGYPAVVARSDRHYNTAVPNTSASEDDYGFTMSVKELGIDFANPIGMEFVWPYTFEHHITPVTGYKKTDGDIAFYMNRGLIQKRESSVFKAGGSFYLQNAKELINKPGEFYYDAGEDFIYYHPYDYENMKTAETYVGNVEGMVKVAGSSLTSKVENITFENLAFRYGANNFISKYGYIGSQTDGILVPFAWSEGNIAYMAQFAVDNADNINIESCEFSCLGSAAISMIDSVSNSSINGNIIRDISGTGIRIGHPIHNRQRDGVEVCRNIDITNNVIRRIAGEMFNNCAITVYYEKFINILHNDIEDTPYSGISVGWGWGGGAAYDHSDIDVSYNKVQNVMNTLHDGGGIYTLGPIKNGVISNNYLNDHGSRSGGMLYNDQGSAYIEVHNNVVLNAVLTQVINALVSTSSTNSLTYYNNYSDNGAHSKFVSGLNINFEDYIIVTGEGETLSNPAAKEIYQKSGIESGYLSLLSKTGVELPAAGREISSTLPDRAPTDETIIYSTEYDQGTSAQNLEMITYADGIGVAITGSQKINYKLNIEKAGYYRIVLRARNEGDRVYNNVVIGGDAQNVIMHLNDNQRSIMGTTDRNYRVCTAYFEAGEQNLTITPKFSDSKISIKELHYENIEKTIKPDKVNLLKIKNYYDLKGITSNTYENNQSDYPTTGAEYHVLGCVTTPKGKTTTLTYKINVEEAGIYKIDAISWLKNVATYTVAVNDATITGYSPQYNSLHKSDTTTIGNIALPAGESTLTFTCTMPSGSTSNDNAYMFYLTLAKQN